MTVDKKTASDSGWKTLGKAAVEDTAGDTIEVEIDTDEPEDEVEVVDKVEPKEEPKKKGNSAQDRIRELAREKNTYKGKADDLESKLSEAQKEIEDLRKGRQSAEKQRVDQAVETTKSLIEAKKTALRKAKMEGDLDAEMALEDDLRELTVSRRVHEAQKEKFTSEETKPPAKEVEKETAKPPALPPKLQGWLGENDWFNTNPRLQKYAAAYADELLAEGLTFNDDDLYTKMDVEMRNRFPEQFGEDDLEVVQSDNNPPSRKDVKAKQIVAGSSRPPVVKKGREVLTREEANTADRLNIPRERYAARKKADRENREPSGWVTISRTKK